MTRRVIYAALAIIGTLAAMTSCKYDGVDEIPPTTVPEGYVAIRFNAEIPNMQEVVTRSVDPDGNGVQDMTLFCFDRFGLFISTATATISPTSAETGSFTATVPQNTRSIHFLANQNMSEFKEDDFRGRSESEVMSVLEGSSGRMIYWARFACDPENDQTIDKQLVQNSTITLIRSHAQVSIANPSNEHLVVTGFAVYNTNAFGTVAPYHPTKGFDFIWPTEADFVTLPVNRAKMSDIVDVSTAESQYIFESENGIDDPVSVIVRGHLPDETEADDLYYRVLLLDGEGNQLLLRRNFHYKLNIAGALSYGQPTFKEATTAAATNNVWISISDDVNEVEDANYILTVEQTNYVLGEEFTGRGYTLNYTLKGKNGTAISAGDKPEVTWLDGNNVATASIGNTFNVVNGVGDGSIQISLLPMGDNEKLEGTLLVRKGMLQRKIKVITIKEQEFVPSWIGTEIYGNLESDSNRAHVTAMFTIPETCPEELFPMNVYLSVWDLDIRNASGMVLPVVRDGDRVWYSSGEISSVYEDREPDYKFLYTAEGPGVQRVYFENILNQANGYEGVLYIEAEHFATMQRKFKYSDSYMSITVQGLNSYDAGASGINDEAIYYRLVPQKKGATVQFDMLLAERFDVDHQWETNNPANAGAKDEFLLYSQYLDYYKDGEESEAGVEAFDCTFYPDESAVWWNKNNPQGGRMQMFKPRAEILNNPPKGTGRYSIYMKTNRASSAEVIRIASNDNRYEPILPEDASADNPNIYGGTSYRSITFELANYNPFRFSARVNGEGKDAAGADEEPVTPLTWTYQPEQKVDIEIDVTSFAGSDGKSADPFGEAFEIYIDAPMLEIDAARLAECNLTADKLKADPNRAGRFIYTVDADREAERAFGTRAALKTDATAGVDQTGERKTLPFVTSSIVSAGEITISSNEEQVVYFSKSYDVTNLPVAGSLKYRDASGVEHAVPRNAFVSFERTRNNSRIGSITVTADGQYELRLRKEYVFNWYTDEVEAIYSAADGKTYRCKFNSLASLFAAPDIVLTAGE